MTPRADGYAAVDSGKKIRLGAYARPRWATRVGQVTGGHGGGTRRRREGPDAGTQISARVMGSVSFYIGDSNPRVRVTRDAHYWAVAVGICYPSENVYGVCKYRRSRTNNHYKTRRSH